MRSVALAPFVLPALVLGPGLSASAPSAWRLPPGRPPIGDGKLAREVRREELAPGLELYRMVFGHASAEDRFEVGAGFAATGIEAVPLVQALNAAGHPSKLVPAADGRAGYMVRLLQAYPTREEADAAAGELRKLELPPSSEGLQVSIGVAYTAEDGTATAGPFRVNLLAVRPGFKGRVQAALATGIVPGTESPSAMALREKALAAVNGGFFVTTDQLGTAGAPAGLSIIDGRLVSEGLAGRSALFLQDRGPRARVEREVSTTLTLTVDGHEARVLDGLNRMPGLLLSGGRAHGVETRRVVHDVPCTAKDDLVLLTPDFGPAIPAVEGGWQAVLGPDGTVRSVDAASGTTAAPGEQVLIGIGTGAEWIRGRIAEGSRIRTDFRVRNAAGGTIPTHSGVFAVNGGPTLLVNGAFASASHEREGWGRAPVPGVGYTMANGDRAAFYNGWYLRRNPRTAAGIAADGTLLLLVCDGRAPGYSAGLSIPETAALMKFLGARNALNLDGGGSSMMVAGGEPLTRPSDREEGRNVERPVADAVLVLP